MKSKIELLKVNEIQERIKKAVEYFLTYIEKTVSITLSELSYSSDNKAILKDFKKDINTAIYGFTISG